MLYINPTELEKFLEAHTIKEAAIYYKCHHRTIDNKIKKYSLKHTKHRGVFNHDYFKTWSSNMAYILGFITADGNIHNKRPYIAIELARKDECVLEFVLSEIYPSGNILQYTRTDKRTGKTYYSSKIALYSDIMKDDLLMYSVFPNKTGKHSINFNIPTAFLGDYVRGFFDGDGCCYISQNRLCSKFSCQSTAFLNDIRYLLDFTNINVYTKSKPPELRFSHKSSLKLRNIMYETHDRFCLTRKKAIFNEL